VKHFHRTAEKLCLW